MTVPCPEIMYVCSNCAEPENNPEGCGHYDRDMVRQAPGGEWVCECCYDEMRQEDSPDWRDLPQSPEVRAIALAEKEGT